MVTLPPGWATRALAIFHSVEDSIICGSTSLLLAQTSLAYIQPISLTHTNSSLQNYVSHPEWGFKAVTRINVNPLYDAQNIPVCSRQGNYVAHPKVSRGSNQVTWVCKHCDAMHCVRNTVLETQRGRLGALQTNTSWFPGFSASQFHNETLLTPHQFSLNLWQDACNWICRSLNFLIEFVFGNTSSQSPAQPLRLPFRALSHFHLYIRLSDTQNLLWKLQMEQLISNGFWFPFACQCIVDICTLWFYLFAFAGKKRKQINCKHNPEGYFCRKKREGGMPENPMMCTRRQMGVKIFYNEVMYITCSHLNDNSRNFQICWNY